MKEAKGLLQIVIAVLLIMVALDVVRGCTFEIGHRGGYDYDGGGHHRGWR